jgi:hypothetical protein
MKLVFYESQHPGTAGLRLWPNNLDTTDSSSDNMAGEPSTQYLLTFRMQLHKRMDLSM